MSPPNPHKGDEAHSDSAKLRDICFRNCSYLSETPSCRKGLISLLVNLLKPYPGEGMIQKQVSEERRETLYLGIFLRKEMFSVVYWSGNKYAL